MDSKSLVDDSNSEYVKVKYLDALQESETIQRTAFWMLSFIAASIVFLAYNYTRNRSAADGIVSNFSFCAGIASFFMLAISSSLFYCVLTARKRLKEAAELEMNHNWLSKLTNHSIHKRRTLNKLSITSSYIAVLASALAIVFFSTAFADLKSKIGFRGFLVQVDEAHAQQAQREKSINN